MYDIVKKEVSLIRSAFLTLLIGPLFVLLIFYFCGLPYGLVTAFAVFLLSIKILYFHDDETNSGGIAGPIVTALAVGLLVGIIVSILVGIIHGFLAGEESIRCGGSYEVFAGLLAGIATALFIVYRHFTAATYASYKIYWEQ
jgi:LytS/YehU family sensor histidine kinase